MSLTMICLVGEQPVPNVLPIRHLRPSAVLLVVTDQTLSVAKHIEALLPSECTPSQVVVDAFDIATASTQLREAVGQIPSSADLIVNLTGGTKPMSLAAFTVARKRGTPIVYMATRPGCTSLAKYGWYGKEPVLLGVESIQDVLTIREYLVAHGLGDYRCETSGQPFEVVVLNALRSLVDEMEANVRIGQLEIDAVVRRGGSVAVVEVKSGKGARKKAGIDQLSTATQREFLGTYTGRILVLDTPLPPHNKALAAAHRVRVVEMTQPWDSGLCCCDCRKLEDVLDQVLGRRP